MLDKKLRILGIIFLLIALTAVLSACDLNGDDVEHEPWEDGEPETHEGLQQALRDEGLENEEGIIVLELGDDIEDGSLEAKKDFIIDGKDKYSIDLEDSFEIREQIEAAFKNIDMENTSIDISALESDTLKLENVSVKEVKVDSGLEKSVSIIVDENSEVEQIVADSEINLYDPDKEIEIIGDKEDDVVYLYSLKVEIAGEGNVEISPEEEDNKYEEDTSVDIEAISEDGWEFKEWTGDVEDTDKVITVTMDSDKEITAVFEEEDDEADKYILDVEIEGEGTVDIDPDKEEYEEDAEVELEAISEDGWEFKEWTGDVEDTDKVITVTMDSDKEITAVFEEEDDEEDGDEENDKTTYRHDYFTFEYPSEWKENDKEYFLVENENVFISWGGPKLSEDDDAIDFDNDFIEYFIDDTNWQDDDGKYTSFDLPNAYVLLIENFEFEPKGVSNCISYLYLFDTRKENYVIYPFTYVAEDDDYYDPELAKEILTSILLTDDVPEVSEYDDEDEDFDRSGEGLDMIARCDNPNHPKKK